MSEIKLRRFLREKEATQLLEEFSQRLRVDVNQLLDAKKPHVEVSETPAAKIFFTNGKPLMANLKDVLVPTLLFEKALLFLPKTTVNMGAVPHICNGADLLAPGIVQIDGNFRTNDYIVIIDERHHKPLAIAIALMDSETARNLQHGKVAKNMHYVGDSLWNQLKKA